MKKLFLLCLLCLFPGVLLSAPLQVVLDPALASPSTQSIQNVWGNASGAIYVHIVGDSAINASASYYLTLNNPPPLRSYQPQYYPVSLATNTGQLVSSLITISFPCILEIGSNKGDIFCGPVTTNANILQTQGKKLKEGVFWSFVATGPIDFGIVADPSETANASGVIIVIPQK